MGNLVLGMLVWMNFAITACASKGLHCPQPDYLTGTLIVIPWLRARWIISAVSKIIGGLTISSGNAFGAFGGSAGITVLRINLWPNRPNDRWPY
jgi:hypothetical protein